MKKLIAALAVLVTVILVGCSAPQTAQSNPGLIIHEKSHKLVDGRRVICVYSESRVVGGYSNVSSVVTDIECEFPERAKK